MDRPILTLTDLEAFDLRAPSGGRERRFCCPLPTCAGKPMDAAHRTLSLNVGTGAWVCYRCGGSGKLREHWQPLSQARQTQLRRAFSVSTTPPAKPAEPVEADDKASEWRAQLEGAVPVADTPGADYLEGRGIPVELATAAGVLYSPRFYGRPAVLFPLRDRDGELVGVGGRYVDGLEERDKNAPKTRTAGRKKLGLFATPGALEAERMVITEAPIDALTLALVGVPAIALEGTNWPDWLPKAAAFKPAVIALDADAAGDEATAKLTAVLSRFGAKVERWRPALGKDWNKALELAGLDMLREAFLPYMAEAFAEPWVAAPAPDAESGLGTAEGEQEAGSGWRKGLHFGGRSGWTCTCRDCELTEEIFGPRTPATPPAWSVVKGDESRSVELPWWVRLKRMGIDPGLPASEVDVPARPGDAHQEWLDLVTLWRSLGCPVVRGPFGEPISDVDRWMNRNPPESWEPIRWSLGIQAKQTEGDTEGGALMG